MLYQFPSWHRTDSLWILTPASHTDCAPPREVPQDQDNKDRAWPRRGSSLAEETTAHTGRRQREWVIPGVAWQGRPHRGRVLRHRKHRRLGNALDGGKHVWDMKVWGEDPRGDPQKFHRVEVGLIKEGGAHPKVNHGRVGTGTVYDAPESALRPRRLQNWSTERGGRKAWKQGHQLESLCQEVTRVWTRQ